MLLRVAGRAWLANELVLVYVVVHARFLGWVGSGVGSRIDSLQRVQIWFADGMAIVRRNYNRSSFGHLIRALHNFNDFGGISVFFPEFSGRNCHILGTRYSTEQIQYPNCMNSSIGLTFRSCAVLSIPASQDSP